MDLGFVGLGIMGTPMALNLLQGGHRLVVWNRTAAACEPLVAAGARRAGSAAEVAAASAVTFACLADPEAALAVAEGPDGICAGLAAGGGYVDMSTVDAGTSTRIAAAVAARGARFLEAPVVGTRGPAEQGRLIILAAGDESLYKEAEAAFGLMGQLHLHLGEVGAGARLKLVVNMVMGDVLVALCEGMDLARRADLDPAVLLDILDRGPVGNALFRAKAPAMLAGDFAPNFPLRHMRKDLRLARALGAERGVRLPLAAAADETFVAALERGAGDRDFSAVWRAFED